MRTFFNILGPLLNPAGVKRQIIGAYSRETASTMAQILAHLDIEAAATVYSHDGLDELSTTASAEVHEVRGRLLTSPYHLDATDFGFSRAGTDDLKGGDAVENARILRSILAGAGTQAQMHVVLLNAGKAIEVSGLAGDLREGIRRAEESLSSGAALSKLDAFIEASR
jgi:anthranilate phosphoribosyltransferase